MFLADGKDDGLTNLTADGVAQGIFKEGLTEELVGCLREEALFKLAVLESFVAVITLLVLKGDYKAII